MTKWTLLTALLALAIAAPAQASSVAYIDSNNLWLASPDGSQKVQLSQHGDADHPFGQPSQGPDGQTVAYHSDAFDVDGQTSHRPVLYLYGADGKFKTANVMPSYSGAIGGAVYPIGLDMDWNSKTVAFGYQYCGWACQSTYKGFWLTFSDQQPMNPSNPQGQSDAFFPTFYKTRVISSDSGGRIFVQPDVAEAPFTSSYEMWLNETPAFRLSRAEVSMTGDFVALDWTQYAADGTTVVGRGIAIGEHQGQVPSNVTSMCNLVTAANPYSLTFSYDGTQMAWADAEGVKVAGVPNLAAGTTDCQLTTPAKVISATGKSPHFGGADVGAIVNPPVSGGQTSGGQTTTPGGEQPQPGQPGPGQSGPGTGSTAAKLVVKAPAKLTRKAFAKGFAVEVAGAAGVKVTGSATIPVVAARKAGLAGKRAKGAAIAAAVTKSFVVARGTATGPGKLKLVPTKAAKRAAKKLRKTVLTITVGQGSQTAKATLKLS